MIRCSSPSTASAARHAAPKAQRMARSGQAIGAHDDGALGHGALTPAPPGAVGHFACLFLAVGEAVT
jgi:hypothetical protein